MAIQVSDEKAYVRAGWIAYILLTTAFIVMGWPGNAHSQAADNLEPHIRIGISKLREVFDPAFAEAANTAAQIRNIHRTLVTYSPKGTISSDLAYLWRINSDYRVYAFCVGQEFFHDGKPITLHDIQYSMNRLLLDPDDTFYVVKDLRRLAPKIIPNKELEASPAFKGGYCFDVQLLEPYPEFLHVLTSSDFTIVPNLSLPSHKIGSGKFRISRFIKQDGILELSRVKPLSDGRVNRISLLEVGTSVMAQERMRAGDIDVFIGVDDFQKLTNLDSPMKVSYLESLAIDHLFFNLKRPYLKDKAFRRDISLLFQHVVSQHDKGQPRGLEYQPHFMPKGLLPPQYYRSQRPRFDQAQFVRRWKGKSPTKKLLVVGTVNQLSPVMIRDLRSYLADINISLEYVSDFYGKSRELITSRRYDLCFISWMGMYERPEAFLHIFDGGLFADTEADEYFRQLLSASHAIRFQKDSQIRQERFMDIVRKIEETHYVIPMFRLRTPILHTPQVILPDSKFRFSMDFEAIRKSR
jgi:MarR-like DNA-binding transcriptional regulator SgrR of sgrS sRNA